MNTPLKIPVNIQENIVKAQKVYESLGEDFIKNNNGKFIAVHTESSNYFIGDTREEAVKLANEKYPKKLVFTRRVGTIEKVAFHSPLGFNQKSNAHIF